MALTFAACGAGGMDAEPDASTGPTWSPLISKTWTLQPGEEKTSDLMVDNVERDIYVGGMRPMSPVGTHHTLLFRGVSGTNMIYASGVGTGELMFPPGKGFKLEAGTVLGLQLHIFNRGDGELTGTSGVEILEVDPSEITDEVDLFLPGPKDLNIPPIEVAKATGTCTVTKPYSVFALFPHMHQLGTHLKTTLTMGGTEKTLFDDAFNFEHQAVLSFDPIQLSVGDKINTECTWNNNTGVTVEYGESSTTEMCYSILYRFPRGDEEFCTN
jgi:hypothetical protein